MQNYEYQKDEVMLCKCEAYRKRKKGDIYLLLTNKSLVLTTRIKELFKEEEIYVEQYPIADIKMYEGIPQVKIKFPDVEIYTLNTVVEFSMFEKKEARQLVEQIYRLKTGKSLATRSADKVNGAIDTVNRALGIDTVSTVKEILENGITGSVFGLFTKKGKASAVQKTISVGNSGNKESESEKLDRQYEMLQKIKKLKDDGILTEDEYKEKKRQILENGN